MNLSKTNPVALKGISQGWFNLENMRKIFHTAVNANKQYGIDLDEGDLMNLGSMLFPQDKDTKIIKVSKQVQENAKLIDFDSIKDKVTDIDLPFKNAIILLSDDSEGMVKVNVVKDENDNLVLSFLQYLGLTEHGEPFATWNAYEVKNQKFNLQEGDENTQKIHQNVIKLMLYLFHGEVTYKKLPPKTKSRLGSLSYFKNDTKMNIWFANSLWKQRISTEGFKVRGHFRLQAHGPGRTLRKLKWIESFEKKGYNREATRTSFEKN